MDTMKTWLLWGAAALALLMAGTALAATVAINDVDLVAAGGDAEFDPDDGEDGCFGDPDMYSPVGDGTAFGRTDAFDGGLILLVEGRPFVVPSGEGDLKGQQLTVGPRTIAGVRVTRIDRALPGSPTLRSLVKLQNTSRKRINRNVTIHSDLGSDSSTVIEASSSGDKVLTRADRWVVTSDEVPLSDPPVTHALRGAGKTRAKMVDAFGAMSRGGDGSDCVFATLNVKLRPRQTGYLLFFVDLSESIPKAVNGAKKYNRPALNAKLKVGLPKGIRSKVLNWNL